MTTSLLPPGGRESGQRSRRWSTGCQQVFIVEDGYLGYTWPMVKVLVSLEDSLLRQIDRRARRNGLSRSAYLAQLAARDVAREKGPGVAPAAREALGRLDALFAGSPEGDSTAAIREERNRR